MSLSLKSFKLGKVTLLLYLICLSAPIAIFLNSDSSVQRQVVTKGNENHQFVIRKDEADRLFQEAMQQYRRRKYQQALEKFQQVLVISREIGDKENEARSLRQIGSIRFRQGRDQIHFRQDRYQQALESYQQALPIYRSIGDMRGEARILARIGGIYLLQRRYPEARESFLQASAIYKKIGDRQKELFAKNTARQIAASEFSAIGSGNILRDDDDEHN